MVLIFSSFCQLEIINADFTFITMYEILFIQWQFVKTFRPMYDGVLEPVGDGVQDIENCF